MEEPNKDKQIKDARPGSFMRANFIILALWLGFIAMAFFGSGQVQNVPYSNFLTDVEQGKVADITITQHQISGVLKRSKEQEIFHLSC